MYIMYGDSGKAVWKLSAILLSIFFLVACDNGNGQTNAEVKALSSNSGASLRKKIKIPTEMEVKKLVGDAQFNFPGEYNEAVPVSDRILDGFEAGPSQFVTDDGIAILWGFKFQQGNLESIMVLDSDGQLVLAGAVDNIIRLIGVSSGVVSSIKEYQDKMKSVGGEPAAVTLFVAEESDLTKYLPLVRRWLQADFLGMNVSCEDDKYKPACALLPYVDVPISAYVKRDEKQEDGHIKVKMMELKVPDGSTSDIPLEKFEQ